jgi:hypothetical protein
MAEMIIQTLPEGNKKSSWPSPSLTIDHGQSGVSKHNGKDHENPNQIVFHLKEYNLCWAEIGNEPIEDSDWLRQFEESVFYEANRFFWNTHVPWRNSPWEGGVLLVLDPSTETKKLKETAERQFERMKDFKRRPLFKRTHAAIATSGDRFDKLVFNDIIASKKVGFEKGKLYTQLLRQVLLCERINIDDCVFLISRTIKRLPHSLTRVPFIYDDCCFFRLSIP